MLDGARSRLVDADGVRLHVVEAGRADDGASTVLVLHGFGGNAGAMEPLAAALAERHRVLVPDLIGHGRSESPRALHRYAWDAVCRHLIALLDARAVDRAHLFGFSLGGRIALRLATRAPRRVGAVVAVGARCAWPSDDERTRRRASDADLARRLDAQEAHGLARALRALGAADQPEVDVAALAAAGTPLALVCGEDDHGPRDAARALAARLPGAEVAAIPGAGHRAHLERADDVARLALATYARADAARETEGKRRPDGRFAAGGTWRATAAQGEERW